jgi:hypothetical protein
MSTSLSCVVCICVTILLLIWMLRKRKYVSISALFLTVNVGDQPPLPPSKDTPGT